MVKGILGTFCMKGVI